MLADELEMACELDAETACELKCLLFDGGKSPMLNPAVPLSELSSLITSIRFGILTSGVELPANLPRLPD
jgi:hypothetical protein